MLNEPTVLSLSFTGRDARLSVVRTIDLVGRTRRAAVRALVKSARESASWRRRSSAPRAPQPPWLKSARKRIHTKTKVVHLFEIRF